MADNHSGSESSSARTNRRKLLRSLGAVSVSGLAHFSTIAGASPPRGVESNRETLEAEARGRVISEAKKDIQFKSLSKVLRRQGWKVDFGDAVVERHSTDTGNVYRTLLIEAVPKAHEQPGEEAVLVWIDDQNDTLELSHHTVAHIVDSADESTSKSKFWGYETLNTLVVEKGRVVAEEKEFPDIEEGNRKVTDGGIRLFSHTDGYGCECAMEFGVFEANLSWACIIRAALGSIAAGISCGGCLIDPTKLSCIGCTISYGLTVDAINRCGGGVTADRVACKCVDPDFAERNNLNCRDDSYIPEEQYERIPGEEVSYSGGC